MHVTTKAIVIEINNKGIVFERLHSQIASVEAIEKKKIKIIWPEGRQLFDFTFKVNDAQKHVKEIVERYNYEDNFPDLMGVNTVMLSEKEQKEIAKKRLEWTEKTINEIKKQLDEANLKLNMIASDDPDKQNKILEAAEETKQIHDVFEMLKKYKGDIPNIILNRSKKIPKEVPNHKCWNDCWYDDESNCYITLNELWNTKWFDEIEEVQKFHEKNTIPNAHAIPFRLTKMKYGYSVCKIPYGENDVRDVFIPSMTDEMLTENIISEKTGFDRDNRRQITNKNKTNIRIQNHQRFKINFKKWRTIQIFQKRNSILVKQKTAP